LGIGPNPQSPISLNNELLKVKNYINKLHLIDIIIKIIIIFNNV